MSGWFSRDAKKSDAATPFGRIFQENDVKYGFYDSLVTCFVNFDEHNQAQLNRLFSNDVEYIVKCTIDDLTSSKNLKKSSQRIESYFYIYRRIEQYIKISKQSDTILHQLRQKLFEMLTTTFSNTKGEQPNICLPNKDLLQEINIFQHVSSITIKNEQTLHTAFVLFKLSIQSSMIIYGHQNRLKWKEMLSKVQDINFSLEGFVNGYLNCKDAFQECPLDMPAFIYLIQKMHPPKQSKNSPFIMFFQLNRKLNLDDTTFFKEFQPIFNNGLRAQLYSAQHISELLLTLSSHDQLFSEYLSTYSSYVLYENLWEMFLHLIKISNRNEIMMKYFGAILTKRISTVSSGTFNQCITSAKEHLKKIDEKTRSQFIEVFGQIYDAFVLKEIQNKGYSNRLTDKNLKELVNIDSSLLPPNRFTRPSNLLVIQQLLFKSDSSATNSIQNIQRLFQNLKDFDGNICRNNNPIGIIEDEWLKDFLIIIPQMWIKIDQDVYRSLCNNHQNNQWTIYVWSRVIQLSLSKTVKENLNMTLFKLNEWMKIVKHDVYHPNDILTIIFVKYLFELIIVKYTNSIIILPSIETIIKFVIAIKEQQPDKINTRQVEDFIRRGLQDLEHILRLKGEVIRKKDCFIYFLF